MSSLKGLVVAAALLSACTVVAAGFPEKPIRVVVGFPPGGHADITARLIGPRLSEFLGQPVLVDNRPGAGGVIGARLVATAVPDGYTLMLVTGAHVATPAVRANPGFDTVRDFAGITTTARAAYLLVVSPAFEARSVKDFVALARARPGALNYTSAGIGSGTHFAAELFRQTAGIEIVHVPQRGVVEAMNDVMAGRVQMFMAPIGSASPFVADGRLRALAITSVERNRLHADVPTVAESGYAGFHHDAWTGLLAPARTPRPLIERLNREVHRVLALPEIQQRLVGIGVEAWPSTPTQFDRFIADGVKLALELGRKASIKPE